MTTMGGRTGMLRASNGSTRYEIAIRDWTIDINQSVERYRLSTEPDWRTTRGISSVTVQCTIPVSSSIIQDGQAVFFDGRGVGYTLQTQNENAIVFTGNGFVSRMNVSGNWASLTIEGGEVGVDGYRPATWVNTAAITVTDPYKDYPVNPNVKNERYDDNAPVL